MRNPYAPVRMGLPHHSLGAMVGLLTDLIVEPQNCHLTTNSPVEVNIVAGLNLIESRIATDRTPDFVSERTCGDVVSVEHVLCQCVSPKPRLREDYSRQ